MKKILVCGGHLTPALALIENLKDTNNQIIFLGRKKVTEGKPNFSAEYQQIKNYNVNFVNIITGRIQRHLSIRTVPSLLKIPIGFIQTFLALLYFRPNIVVSFGGSLSFLSVFSAWLLGIDSITHEQSSVPGLSNRLNSLFVRKVFISWPQSLKYFPKGKSQVIGNLEVAPIKNLADKRLKNVLKSKKPLLLVSGGNQGSHFINSLIFDNIDKLNDFNIVHQIGTTNFGNDHTKAAQIKSPNYISYDFIESKVFTLILKTAAFIISRSGANTVWQIASSGKIAVLIPLPHSAYGEQQANAQILKNAGSVIVLDQSQTTFTRLQKALEELESNYKSMQSAALKLSNSLPKNAAKILIKQIESMVSSPRL